MQAADPGRRLLTWLRRIMRRGQSGIRQTGDGGPAPASFEYRSRLKVMGLPLVHIVRGIDPSSGRRPTAVGIVAIGQVAVGLVAIGQVAVGAISLGQASIGLGWGIGQLAFGMLAAGQVGAGLLGSVGQIAVGPHALGMATDPGLWVAVGLAARRAVDVVDAAAAPPPAGAAAGHAAQTDIASVRDGRSHVAGRSRRRTTGCARRCPAARASSGTRCTSARPCARTNAAAAT